MSDPNQIRTAACPRCLLCGSEGAALHSDLQDRLFSAPGSWSLRKCHTPACGLIWLDPMPLAEDIVKAYAEYYTHGDPDAARKFGLVNRIYRQMKAGYLRNHYGYRWGPGSVLVRACGLLLYLFPLRRGDVDAEIRFLHSMPHGRLLDVGCGSGEWLLSMKERRWQVEGLDFDEKAVATARQKGLEVKTGALEQQSYPAGSFDVVTLNHVIEHLPNPVNTLKECLRVLKPGGKLVLFTPNAGCLGHRVFQEHWRGLEPPRHLHVFRPAAIRRLLEAAGFKRPVIRTLTSEYVWRHSLRVWAGKTPGTRLWGSPLVESFVTYAFSWLEQGFLLASPQAGEVLAVQALKPSF